MKSSHPVVIIGAGLAGLSLAVRLIALPKPPKILLIDRRTTFERDRTWCHWAVQPHPFTHCVSHRWTDWTVGDSSKTIQRSHPQFAYERIPSDVFYREALAQLEASGQVETRWGVAINEVIETSSGVTITLADQTSIQAQHVFDSRPNPQLPAGWRQIFRGLELKGAHNANRQATLMDFQSAGPQGIRFFYVLPLSADTLLVEDTWIVPPGVEPKFNDDEIIRYTENKFGKNSWQSVHQEQGVIPMQVIRPTQSSSKITPIGTAGGAVRASSGYAFSRIQIESDQLARTYAAGKTHFKHSRGLNKLDEIFLKVIEQEPHRFPELMIKLFERVPPARLLRFMESVPTWADQLAVMSALPTRPFLSAWAKLLR